MGEFIINSIKDTFTTFGGELESITKIVVQSPESNQAMWQIITGIFNVLLPVGYTLASLFFVIDFLNKSIMMEYMRWENIAKSLFKLVVCKMIMENSFKLLSLIFGVAGEMITKVSSYGLSNIPNMLDMAQIEQHVNSLSFWGKLMYFIEISPMTFIMKIIKIAIMVIVYGRMIEIYIYTAVAPLPLSTLSSEGLSQTAKKFFQEYAGVCLQGLIIIISCILYGGLMADVVTGKGIESLITVSLVLLLVLVKSGSWAKKVTGAM